MKKIIFLIAILISITHGSICQNVDFSESIDKIENDVNEMTLHGVEDGWYGVYNIPDLLFLMITGNKNLYFIFTHPRVYRAKLLTYIEDPATKWEYKYFALGLLQGLCPEDYLPVANDIYNLFDGEFTHPPVDPAKPVSANNFHPALDVLSLCINQGNLSWEICKNEHKKEVSELLKKIIKNEKVHPSLKEYCSRVLSGEIYNVRKANLQKHLITPPLVNCHDGKAIYSKGSDSQ